MRIDCDDEKVKESLIEELEQLRTKEIDKDGKLQVISKDEIKERIGRSSDLMDMLYMRCWFEFHKGEGSVKTWIYSKIAKISEPAMSNTFDFDALFNKKPKGLI